jgi:uncharacterized iron-regulated membrane protein
MWIRRVHRILGLVFAPFFVLVAVTGGLLLFRKHGLYDVRTKHTILDLHNWEIVGDLVGLILAVGLLAVACTGVWLRWQIWFRKRKATLNR